MESNNTEKKSQSPIEITFQKSGKTVAWDSKYGCLLELAEDNDIEICYGCRVGADGVCLTPILSGEVYYLEETCYFLEEGECLPCMALPKGNLVLDA